MTTTRASKKWVSFQVRWTSLFGSSTCGTRSATKRASSFLNDLAAIVTEEGGTPHTINLCRNCQDSRRSARRGQGEQRRLGSVDETKHFLRQAVGRFRWQILQKKCGTDSQSRKRGPERCWKKQQEWCSEEQTAAGKTSRRTKRNSSSCEKFVTCASVVLSCVKHFKHGKQATWLNS